MASRIERLPLVDLSTMFAAVDQVEKSKKEATRKYLGNNFTVVSVKPHDLDMASLFFSTAFHLDGKATDREEKKRNLQILCGLRSIFTSDYPEAESLMKTALLFPFLSVDALLMRTIWFELARELVIFEKMYVQAFAAWAKIKIRKDQILASAPDGIALKQTATGYDYKLSAPEIYSTRLIAFLGKLFKKQFNPESGDRHVIKASSSHFLDNIDLIQFFCNDEDASLRDFARKLYWLATFEEAECNLKVIRSEAIRVHKKSSRFALVFGMEKFTTQAKEFVGDYWAVHRILFPATSASSSGSQADFTTLPEESLREIIAINEHYLAQEAKKEKELKTLTKLIKEIKMHQLSNVLFTSALRHFQDEMGVTLDTDFICSLGLKSIVDLDVVAHLPLIDTAEFHERAEALLSAPIVLKELIKPKLADITASSSNLAALSGEALETVESALVASAAAGAENIAPVKASSKSKAKATVVEVFEPIIEIPLEAISLFARQKAEPFLASLRGSSIRVAFDDISYSDRVETWFSDPESILASDRYASQPKAIKEHVHFIHTFPSIIDSFVGTQYSAFMPYINPTKKGAKAHPNWLFALPCEAEKGGMTHRGFLVYVIDPETKECFHRCFDIESKKYPLGTAMMHGWDHIVENFSWSEIDFPDLATAMARSSSSAKSARSGSSSALRIQYEISTDIVTIHVPDGTIYRLFKIL
jgi:hypothetical protein